MDAIVNEIIQYLRNYLEKPNKQFSGWPICPFAKQARLNNKIEFCVCDLKELPKNKIPFLKKENILWFIHHKKEFDQLELEQITENLRKEFEPKFEFFTGHPESEIFTRQEPYPNILIQDATFLNEKRSLLKKTNYYQL